MIKDLLSGLLDATINNDLEWEATSNPFEFYSYWVGVRYSIEGIIGEDKVESFVINQWDDNGDPKELPMDSSKELDIAKALYNTILISNDGLFVRFNTFLKKMKEEKESKERNYSVSLHKIMARLGYNSKEERPRIRIKETESFYYKNDDPEGFIPKYVQPPMSQIPTTEGMVSYQDAEVILISAPGATGKTAMSDYVSFMLHIPILNLGKHAAVGANSISGLIMTQVEKEDVFVYHSGLGNGSCAMVIDGLDEASIHITQDSFEAFLKDVAFFAKGSTGLPFIVLGRPNVMEDAALALEENGVKVSLLQIEPFTIDKAILFIDNQLPKDYVLRYEKQYKDLRDYIIEQIGGFFKNESEINKKLFEHFIGYAPVLQSISNLLSENKDYHKLYDELKEDKKQKVELLIDIVQRILVRERKKIQEEVLQQLFDGNHSQEFKTAITEECGNENEQCKRILGRLLDKEIIINISGEERFDELYNAKVNEWIKNHPFLKGNEKKIQNIVFESYLVAKFIEDEDSRSDVLEYLNKTDSESYLLLDIYSTINGGKTHEINHSFFPYLYKSFKALDHPKDIGNTEILSDDDEVEKTLCYLNFCRKEIECEYDFVFTMPTDESLSVPSPISSLTIDAPLCVELSDNKTDIQAPTTITCNKLSIFSKDILFSTPESSMGNVVFECKRFLAQCQDGNVPTVTFRTPKENNGFLLITNDRVYHPFNGYLRPLQDASSTAEQTYSVFQKLRRMILMFRSHSKGSLARCCSKIDNRIGKTDLGRAIIKGLEEKGVLESDGMFYYINSDKFAEVLGVKYDDIRSSTINEKTKSFIQSLIVE